jgi:hypothetical protein
MKLLLSAFIFLFVQLVYSQSGLYIISEKYDGIVANLPSFDSVYVTNPQGLTIKYSIRNYVSNPGGHDSDLAIILNNIISQGYNQIIYTEKDGVSNNALLAAPYAINKTMYFVKP